MPCFLEVLGDEALREKGDWNIACLVALAVHAEVQDALPLLEIADTQATELLPA